MSIESALEFVGRLQRDSRFRRQYSAAKIESRATQFLFESGFSFNEPELEAARKQMDFHLADPDMLKDLRATEDEMGGVMIAFCGCNDPTAPESMPSRRDQLQRDQQLQLRERQQIDPKVQQRLQQDQNLQLRRDQNRRFPDSTFSKDR